MERIFLKKDNFEKFVEGIAGRRVVFYIQKDKAGNLHLAKYDDALKDHVVGGVRPFEPLKNFFFYARERIVDGYGRSAEANKNENKLICVIGVKNCDLAGLSISDYVFSEGDVKDPFYVRNRESNIIIAADCTDAIDTCYCHAIGHEHFPEKNYDILMSELGGGYVLEAATPKGRNLLDENRGLFEEATSEHIEERDHIRKRAGEKVEKNIRENNIPRYTEYAGIIKENLESGVWKRETETCVECGSCNVVCPTCHCFYLVDREKDGNTELRYRIWDSCLQKRFARVAGGANPRAHLWERLRNRFEKKFDYFPEVSGMYACTGCGRCISGCPAKIDIRRVLKDLVAEKKGKV